MLKRGNRKVIEVKQVVVPIADDGTVLGTKKVIAKWICPTCGMKLGQPIPFHVEQENGWVMYHLFKNICDHRTKYEELVTLQKIIH